MGETMNNRNNNKIKIFFEDFKQEELKQPANDNYIQQPTLPLNFANDNFTKKEKE
jgi:hypothetical protein